MADFIPFDQGSGLTLNQRRAVILRWWLLAAAVIAVAAAPAALDIALPRLPMLAVLALMAVFNAHVQRQAVRNTPLGAGEMAGQLCVDLVALAILLFLSGGAANPLISFLLVPVAVAALSLPGTLTAVIAVLAIALYSLLMWQFLPLSVADPERAARLHLGGMWLTFVVSATMIAWFVARMTASIRDRDRQLAAVREQALRDERVVALGAMAAGAAHEFGTPLATMAVVLGELEHGSGLDDSARDDIALVRRQISACKEIISDMVARAGTLRPEQLAVRDAAEWVRGVRARWHSMRPRASSRISLAGEGMAPHIAVEATLEQALVNLLNNAADANDAEIEVRLGWDDATLTIEVGDRGPGFPDDVLRRAGRSAMPTLKGSGIGLLLAFSAVERLGGRILLDNPSGGGGRARIELPVRSPGMAGGEGVK